MGEGGGISRLKNNNKNVYFANKKLQFEVENGTKKKFRCVHTKTHVRKIYFTATAPGKNEKKKKKRKQSDGEDFNLPRCLFSHKAFNADQIIRLKPMSRASITDLS